MNIKKSTNSDKYHATNQNVGSLNAALLVKNFAMKFTRVSYKFQTENHFFMPENGI